jgi:hypothetical protein
MTRRQVPFSPFGRTDIAAGKGKCGGKRKTADVTRKYGEGFLEPTPHEYQGRLPKTSFGGNRNVNRGSRSVKER